MIRFLDGPAAGGVLDLRAAPERLRVVRAPDGTWDALDQPGDEPRPGETVYHYSRVGSVSYGMMDYRDKSSRRRGRSFVAAEYRHAPERLVHVDAPHFCAGLIVDDGDRVIDAAPILRWAVGRSWLGVWSYFDRKGWSWC